MPTQETRRTRVAPRSPVELTVCPFCGAPEPYSWLLSLAVCGGGSHVMENGNIIVSDATYVLSEAPDA